MLVTINTDASFNRKHKLGAYAYWISCDDGKFQHAGVLKGTIERPEEAEFKCIINAVYTVSTLKLNTPIHRIIINTDCLNVIHLAKQDLPKIQEYKLAGWGLPLYESLVSIVTKAGYTDIPIDFKHVKAHTTTETKRAWVNNWCDEQAKKALKKFITK